jgi:hypothetical protein
MNEILARVTYNYYRKVHMSIHDCTHLSIHDCTHLSIHDCTHLFIHDSDMRMEKGKIP